LRNAAFALLLSAGTLNSWNQEFDEKIQPFIVPDNRGKSSKVTIEVVRRVVQAAEAHKAKDRRIRISRFTKGFSEKDGIILSSKTVREILIANGLHCPQARRKRPRFYQSVRQRIPNGLLSVDGSEVMVWIEDQAIKFNLEMSVDVGSFAHTAFSIADSETSEEFMKVIEAHRKDWGCPVGVLCDHDSANLSEVSKNFLKSQGIEIVPAGPANAKGNGTVEGAFSELKEVIGVIGLDTSSPRALARSVLEIVISVYIKMRNKLTLRREIKDPLSRMAESATEQERASEKQRLQNHNKTKAGTDTDQRKEDLLHFLIKDLRMNIEPLALKRAVKTIKGYEMEAIIAAEKAFVKAINRKAQRKNLPYFFGILKNIQQKRDDQVYERHCRNRYNYDQLLKNERCQQQLLEEQRDPEVQDVLNILLKAVKASKRFVKDLALRRAQEWVDGMREKCRYIGPAKRKFKDELAKMNQLSIEEKEKIWKLIENLFNPKSEGECVTII
jgi:hypothetical protein